MLSSKSFKRIIGLLLVISMFLSLIGCSTNNVGNNSVGDNEESKNEQEVNEITEIKITDHLGREVVFKEKPKRIVSGYYITTSLLIALGLEDNVVGIEVGADKRPIYLLAAPQFIDLPNVGSAKNFDLEGCAALEPDLVVLPIRLREAVENLEKLGINVIAVNPENMDLLKETIDMVSKATGTEDRGERLKSYYDSKLAEMKEMVGDSEKKRVYMGGNSDFLSTPSKNMFQNYMIEDAGGFNVTSDIDDTYWAVISYEQLLNYNPDVIIIVPSAVYSKEDILNDEKLKSITAIKNGDVYTMPDAFEAWDSPVPSSILGTMWLSSILNEDKYPYDKFKDEAVEFYKEFYDIEINKEELTK
ncbi:MAG: ABC transporter substrate-binding protein [Clostridiales bacterium]|nr:ABC transporter substrate-binding protein [Clostridiales bacterium]